MEAGLFAWSEQHLGQWHYVLGYALVLLSHNWPIALALVLCGWFGYKAYRRPNRLWVTWLLTALLLGLAYEYEKHVASELRQAIGFLFGLELAPWNGPLQTLVGPGIATALHASLLVLLAQAIRLTFLARPLRPAPSAPEGGPPDGE